MAAVKLGKRGRSRKAPSPKMRKAPQQSRGTFTVDSVLDAAEIVLGRDGIDGFTTNRVAEVAGVSIGTLYQYFPNKIALAAALHDRHLQAYEALAATAFATGGSPGEKVGRLIAALIERFTVQPRIHRALWQLRSATGMHARIDVLTTKLATIVQAWFVAQGVAAERAADLALVLVHAVDGVVSGVANRADVELGSRLADSVALLVESFVTAATATQ